MTADKSGAAAPERRITMRDIAREVGISHVAVSKALRGLNGVSDATRSKVLKKAEEMGYTPDPLLGVLSHYRKSSKTKPVQAELAWLNLWQAPEQLQQLEFINLLRKGAEAGAKRLGFHLQEFRAAEIPRHRLDSILKTRCIQGLLIPPVQNHVEGWDAFPWTDYAAVLLGRQHPYPQTHFVSTAQTANTILAFNRMTELGYQRIGFTCELLEERYFGAGFSWAQKKLPKNRQLPAFVFNAADPEEKQKALLDQWIRKYQPDAILNDYGGTHAMLNELGFRIPEDIGLAGTGINDSTLDAGIDQKPEEIGRAAVRNLAALMAENSFGIPEIRNEILVEGRWVDGSMMPPKNNR